MADFGVKFNIAAFEELRTSDKVTEELMRRGQAIADACGSGYRVQDSSGKTRARVTVWPDTEKAKRTEAIENNLIRNLDRGR